MITLYSLWSHMAIHLFKKGFCPYSCILDYQVFPEIPRSKNAQDRPNQSIERLSPTVGKPILFIKTFLSPENFKIRMPVFRSSGF